jgi:hypothetical protein
MDRDAVFLVAKERDPDGKLLREALRVQAALERARAVRNLLLYGLAASGAPLWLVTLWPELGSRGLRAPALVAWASCLAGLALQLPVEWTLRRRRSEYVDRLDPLGGGRRSPPTRGA